MSLGFAREASLRRKSENSPRFMEFLLYPPFLIRTNGVERGSVCSLPSFIASSKDRTSGLIIAPGEVYKPRRAPPLPPPAPPVLKSFPPPSESWGGPLPGGSCINCPQ